MPDQLLELPDGDITPLLDLVEGAVFINISPGVDADEVPYFAVVAELPTVADARAAGVREVGHLLDELEAGLLMTAVALANWHASHGYSPGSGGSTTAGEGGWVRTDDSGRQLFPRTDPAVIVLVTIPDGFMILFCTKSCHFTPLTCSTINAQALKAGLEYSCREPGSKLSLVAFMI